MTAELIACEVPGFTDKLLTPQILAKLFGFYTRPPLNVTLTGYMQKTLLALLKRDADFVISHMSKHNLFTVFLGQLHMQGVSDILDFILTDSQAQCSLQRMFILQGVILLSLIHI